MRILFFNDAIFRDIPGGSRVVTRELAEGLAARGHEVTILAGKQVPGSSNDFYLGGVRVVLYPGAGNPLAFICEAAGPVRGYGQSKPFDLVHTHFAYAALGPLQAVPGGTPHIRSFYGPWDKEGWVADAANHRRPLGRAKAWGKRWLRHQIEAANLRRSQRVVVLSEHSRGDVQIFGYPDRDVHMIPGGTDVRRFAPATDKMAVRRPLGLPLDRTLLLSIRRLVPRMGLENLIRALPAVAARCPDILLLIGGRGPEKEHLGRLIGELGMVNHIRLLGFIPEDELVAYYQAADLFVLPSLALEGFGLVTTEALACGLPVVGTPVGATPELLSGLDPRLLTAGVSPEALADTILAFFENDWAQTLTSDRMHRFVLDHYRWDYHIEAVEKIYQELVRVNTDAKSVAVPACPVAIKNDLVSYQRSHEE